MARIVGVDIPRNKKVPYSLCYIHGIGLTIAKQLCETAKVDFNARVQDLTEEQIVGLRNAISNLNSNVEGELKKDKTLMDALMAGFPAGTVTGAPKIRAMQIIDELETTKRGPYAGAVGYFSSMNEMDTCIAVSYTHLTMPTNRIV